MTACGTTSCTTQVGRAESWGACAERRGGGKRVRQRPSTRRIAQRRRHTAHQPCWRVAPLTLDDAEHGASRGWVVCVPLWIGEAGRRCGLGWCPMMLAGGATAHQPPPLPLPLLPMKQAGTKSGTSGWRRQGCGGRAARQQRQQRRHPHQQQAAAALAQAAAWLATAAGAGDRQQLRPQLLQQQQQPPAAARNAKHQGLRRLGMQQPAQQAAAVAWARLQVCRLFVAWCVRVRHFAGVRMCVVLPPPSPPPSSAHPTHRPDCKRHTAQSLQRTHPWRLSCPLRFRRSC
jgi:hypothetical protein